MGPIPQQGEEHDRPSQNEDGTIEDEGLPYTSSQHQYSFICWIATTT